MAKEREDRYPTAMTLATAVRELAELVGAAAATPKTVKESRQRTPLTVLLGGPLPIAVPGDRRWWYLPDCFWTGWPVNKDAGT